MDSAPAPAPIAMQTRHTTALTTMPTTVNGEMSSLPLLIMRHDNGSCVAVNPTEVTMAPAIAPRLSWPRLATRFQMGGPAISSVMDMGQALVVLPSCFLR
jgi:hypothetical protein